MLQNNSLRPSPNPNYLHVIFADPSKISSWLTDGIVVCAWALELFHDTRPTKLQRFGFDMVKKCRSKLLGK